MDNFLLNARRWRGPLALAFFLVLLQPLAFASNVLDQFNTVAYSNNNGSANWASNWAEINDDGSASAGNVRIVADINSNRLRIAGGSRGASRAADLSSALSATLSFDYRRSSFEAGDSFTVEVSANDGASWVVLNTFTATSSVTDAGYTTVSYDISDYAASNTQIRFVSGSSNANNDLVYFDNVQIVYTVAPISGAAQASLSCGTTLTAGGIINTYYPGTASITTGATSIPVGTASGNSQAIVAGDTLIVMQMQDATINSTNTNVYGDGVASSPANGATTLNNAGLYEYVTATGPVSGGAVPLLVGVTRAYTVSAATATQGQRTYQVIRVPKFSSGTLVSGLTAKAWDGSTGGVLALDVTGALALGSALVDVSGKGFRGGGACQLSGGSGANTDYRTSASTSCPTSGTAGSGANGAKGEGVAGTPRWIYTSAGLVDTGVEGYPNGSFARGAPGNAGGGGTDGNPSANDENTGGGGGGNGGVGGNGGWAWVPSGTPPQTGGFGGAAVTAAANRLFLGGGGGAATVNNYTGTPAVLASSGAAGGGIVIIRAGSLSGTGTIYAKGLNGNTTTDNDGSGGGGAGGSVSISVGTGTTSGLTIDARGGAGGSNSGAGVSHGPGGGGGGGAVVLSTAGASVDVRGGVNGMTVTTGGNGLTYTTDYGSTSGANGTSSTASLTQPSAACTVIDHIQVEHDGTASVCAREPVTFKACLDASCSSLYTSGSITLTPTATPSGTWYDASGNVITSVTLTNGIGAGYLSYTTPNSVTLGVTGVSVTANGNPTCKNTVSGSASCVLTFSNSTFVFSEDAANHIAGTFVAVAGRTHDFTVSAYRADPSLGGTCSIDTGYTGSKTLKTWYTRDSFDPGGASPKIGGISLPTSQPVANNITLTFNSGVATFNLDTFDVGKYALNFLDDSKTYSANNISGTSQQLTVRPFALAVSGIKKGTINNPSGSGNNGSKFIAAGDSFQATVGGYLWNSAGDANNDGVPDSSATLAQVTGAGAAPSFAWPVTLSAGSPYVPSSGALGVFSNGGLLATAFSGGTATPSNLSYSEVGSFTLTAGATAYLNTAGLDLTGLIFSSSGSQSTSTVVGRFYPDHFTMTGSTVAHGCSAGSFTYQGQPFNVTFTLEARNKSNTVVQNYDSTLNYAPQASGTGVLSLVAENNNSGSNWSSTGSPARLSWTAPSVVWSKGSFSISSTSPVAVTFVRAANAESPYSLWALGLKLTDSSDGVTAVGDMNAATSGTCSPCDAMTLGGAGRTTNMLYGRLKIDNVYGSELVPLPIAVEAQSWNGTNYARNTLDTCTSIPTSSFSISGYAGAGVTTSISTTSSVLGTGIYSPGTGKLILDIPKNPATNASPISGKGSILLKAISPLDAYLPGSGIETFGVYKAGPVIYLREVY